MEAKEVVICKKCILPTTFRDIEFNEDGICSYCTSNKTVAKERNVSPEYKAKCIKEIDEIIESVRGKGQYDCAVGFSGGKDSTYLLWVLKEKYKLNVLAIAVDHGFMPNVTIENINTVPQKLGIDLVTFKINSGFMERFFKYKFYNYKSKAVFDSMCGDCSDILEGSVMRVAASFNIPLVFIGLSPEQVNRYFYEVPYDHINSNWEKEFLNSESFNKNDKLYMWNAKNDSEKKLKVILPFHVWDYSEDEVVKKLEELDLLTVKNSNPLKTRCKILDTMCYVDKHRLGYDGFVAPFSDLIRFGKAPREKYYDLFYGKDYELNMEHVNEVISRLDLDMELILNK
ncbi:adenine nucleotide alpha hydrolase family protein [Acetivibrio mesophilus]|uniref:Uncharacterized protein n=1 Tax=Acetivibrio mesophilus TaxID=2487273 RepID=A0A4Q0I2A3_9FIRM|nr:ATP-binding protein [Acetivibrio mesophilus]ODM26706.1 hypothetical protein A7W90_11045 [Clostridium sp. Bc-iso-3]RXE58271.1 hypothetical protein EFD62_13290 [Acetivibrio mesophilus]HHV30581.1 hypothetical protein [Clostridium sp.]HOA79436.1 ATP-binding protein [Defluviitaleaceae bacterium]